MPSSMYLGIPLSVFRRIDDVESDQPIPKGPFPEPESYDKLSCTPLPFLPGLVTTGTSKLAVPVAGLTENFSPMPRIDPPALGRETDGKENGELPMGGVLL